MEEGTSRGKNEHGEEPDRGDGERTAQEFKDAIERQRTNAAKARTKKFPNNRERSDCFDDLCVHFVL